MKNKFTAFLSYTKSFFEPSKETQIHNYALSLLKEGSTKSYIELLNNGYIPNENNSKKFYKNISNVILKKDYDFLSYIIFDSKIDITPEQTIDLIFNLSLDYNDFEQPTDKISNTKKTKDYFRKPSNFINYCLEKSQQEEYQKLILKYFKDHLKDNFYSTKTFDTVLSNAKAYSNKLKFTLVLYAFIDINKIKKNELIEINNFIYKLAINLEPMASINYLPPFINFAHKQHLITNKILTEHVHNMNPNGFDNMLSETKLHFISDTAIKKAIINKNIFKNIEQPIPETLSNDIKIIISQIQDTYSTILTHKEDILIEESKSLIDNKLPILMNNYLTMTPEYRNTMKNSNGKNAHDLLIESLANLAEKLDSNLELLQKDNLTHLSAQNRLFRKINN